MDSSTPQAFLSRFLVDGIDTDAPTFLEGYLITKSSFNRVGRTILQAKLPGSGREVHASLAPPGLVVCKAPGVLFKQVFFDSSMWIERPQCCRPDNGPSWPARSLETSSSQFAPEDDGHAQRHLGSDLARASRLPRSELALKSESEPLLCGRKLG